MDTHIETDLQTLRQKLLTMAGHAGQAVTDALQALLTRDDALAQRSADSDSVIDQFELEIDELVIQHLTKAPLATDLRFVTRVMKISQNLERIGDEATKIARRAHELCQTPPVQIDLDLPRMAGLALDMLNASLEAFNQRDPVAARAVIPRDKEVDLLNKQIQRTLIEHMIAHPDTISRCLFLMDVSKSLERIGDHATNVAENVVYLSNAEEIRHTGAKDVAPTV